MGLSGGVPLCWWQLCVGIHCVGARAYPVPWQGCRWLGGEEALQMLRMCCSGMWFLISGVLPPSLSSITALLWLWSFCCCCSCCFLQDDYPKAAAEHQQLLQDTEQLLAAQRQKEELLVRRRNGHSSS